jgi:hypothetical protein
MPVIIYFLFDFRNLLSNSYYCTGNFYVPYMQGFVTDHDTALNDLYGVDGQNNSKKFNDTITMMATRIATTFASLKVYH